MAGTKASAVGVVRSSLPARVGAVALLALFVLTATLGSRGWTATFDETTELPAGLTYLAFEDYRLNFGHPPLVKKLAAWPALASGAAVPPLDDTGPLSGEAARDSQYDFGRRLLFATHGNDPSRLLRISRTTMLVFPALLGVLLWLWARELFGEVAATVTLALLTFDPAILGHGPLVKNDVPMACLTLGFAYLLWRCLGRLSAGNLLGAAGFFAAAAATKYNAVVLLPIAALVLGARALHAQAWSLSWRGTVHLLGSRARRLVAGAVLLAAVAMSGWLGVWSAFGWRFDPTPDPSLHFPVRTWVERGIANARRDGNLPKLAASSVCGAVLDRRLLPEAALFGFLANLGDMRGHRGYLCGESRDGGWWYYFPVALAVKTPLPTLLLAFAGLALTLAGRARPRTRVPAGAVLLALVPLAILGLAMTTRLNIGVRHVFQVVPFIFLAGGVAAAAALGGAGRWPRLALAGALVWLATGTVRVSPHHLAYFNELAGGPESGHRWLTDSNLDWGQDLPALAAWMRERGVASVGLAYFGTAAPEHYGIAAVCLPGGFSCKPSGENPTAPAYLAMSETVLSGVYLSAEQRAAHAELLAGATHVATLGHTIRIFRRDVPHPDLNLTPRPRGAP